MPLNKIEPHMLTFEPALKAEVATFNQQLANRTKGMVSVTEFGAIGDDVADDTDAFNLAFATGKMVLVPTPPIAYRMRKFQGVEGQYVLGIGKPKINLYHKAGTSVVLVGLANHSRYENLYINSTETNLEWNRCDITSKVDVQVVNCKIEGFRDVNANTWGIYLDKSSDITIDNCEFENNTQADITILEGCKNVTIINPKGSNLHLNFEPNTGDPVENVNVIGGHFNKVSLIEPSSTATVMKNVTFSSGIINNLVYRGSSVKFNSCVINNLELYQGDNFAGSADFGGSLSLSESLIEDSGIYDISSTGDNTAWKKQYFSDVNAIVRIKTDYGEVLRFNPDLKNMSVFILHKKTPVEFGKHYAIKLKSTADYPIGSAWIGKQVQLYYYDVSNVLLSTKYLYFNRTIAGTASDFNEEIGFFTPPVNAVSVEVCVGNTSDQSTSNNSLDVASITFHKVIYKTSTNEVGKQVTENKKYITVAPSTINWAGNVYTQGTKLYYRTPVAGGYEGVVNTVAGNPGTFKGFGLIEV